jgi:hypothetical protein
VIVNSATTRCSREVGNVASNTKLHASTRPTSAAVCEHAEEASFRGVSGGLCRRSGAGFGTSDVATGKTLRLVVVQCGARET